ncbi:TOBE domain-containing protein [Rhizobium sp. 2YAF20]|uniref:TOBE domain-containing protein n=1 Tax=Rhizobium sp. 2YAF20 TaxID=3233027 RepID=UPI003F99B676
MNASCQTAKGNRIGAAQLGELVGNIEAVCPVTYSIRLEWIRLSNSRLADHENCFEGTVEEINYHGQSENVLVRLPGQASLVAALKSANSSAAVELKTGEKIWMAWQGRDARVLGH